MSTADMAPWQELLDELGRDVGLDGLAFGEDGYCSLALDDGRVLHLDVQEEGLLIMTALGEAPTDEKRVRVLEALLAANAFWVGTRGATLALDPDVRQVLLMRREPLEVLKRRGLRELLGEVIEASDVWSAHLSGEDGGSGREPDEPGVPSGFLRV
jgi:hypothetical protein